VLEENEELNEELLDCEKDCFLIDEETEDVEDSWTDDCWTLVEDFLTTEDDSELPVEDFSTEEDSCTDDEDFLTVPSGAGTSSFPS